MKKILLICTLFAVAIFSHAQEVEGRGEGERRPRFSQHEFRQRMQDFITKEANLTHDEAKVFFPVFNEYKNEQRKINMDIHALKRSKKVNEETNFEERLMKIAKLNTELAALDSVYYKKLCKLISAEKLFKILNIEDRMHRHMLQNYNRQHGPRGKK